MRALAERLFWAVCGKVLRDRPRARLRAGGIATAWRRCSRTPTSATSRSSSRCPTRWAIKQLFPIMPIHRLNEEPTRRGGPRRHHLRLGRQDRPVHRPARRAQHAGTAPATTGEPYYLGAFLLGAYQEILGDLHNLFGDTNAVHVSLDDDGDVDRSTRSSRATRCARCCTTCSTRADEADRPDAQGRGEGGAPGQDHRGREQQFLRFYETGLEGYTYLEEPSA